MAAVDATRVRVLNGAGVRRGARYVVYWMQQSQRAEHNDALEYAAGRANELGLPLIGVFGLTDGYPDANLRHYRFMLEGLAEVRAALQRRGIRFWVLRRDPADAALEAAEQAALVVCDRGYLRHQKAWRRRVADAAPCAVVEVEADVVVPVERASDKAEHAARTIRGKLRRHWNAYLRPLEPTPLQRDSLGLSDEGLDIERPHAVLAELDVDRSVRPNPLFEGGTRAARRLLEDFIDAHLHGYDANRNQPQTDYVSHMSKYLHFGQISPVRLALAIRAAQAGREDTDSYLDELLVRRELAINFVHFTKDYDRYACLPAWARATLAAHRDDRRPHVYTSRQLAEAATHDPYWNAAMRELKVTGYMHNYMRMYWGKKILEWTNTPEHAYRVALELNNRYFVDGRDANSYANVGWVFGLHDRPWPERSIFGKVRYMAASGLERKAEPEAYVEKVDRLARRVEAALAPEA